MKTNRSISRRQLLAAATSGVAVAGLGPRAAGAATTGSPGAAAPFRYCLNTSTIRGQNLGIEKEIEIAATAGYDAIEPWVRSVEDHARKGGSLKDLRKKIADLGLTVEGAIGFARWIVDDDAQRAQALEQVKREMDLLAQVGGIRTAAPPAGANRASGLDLMKAAERFRALLELGDQTGVTPTLEIWGSSATLSRLGEAAFVAIETGHPKASILPDVYHVYKGGSDFNGLKLLSNRMIRVFHLNDYPADPPRDRIRDRDRVMPGDGIAPLSQILRDLSDNGGGQVLSLELFNPDYWKQDALEVARTGLAKMKAAVAKAAG